jgi:hypothetical protein
MAERMAVFEFELLSIRLASSYLMIELFIDLKGPYFLRKGV